MGNNTSRDETGCGGCYTGCGGPPTSYTISSETLAKMSKPQSSSSKGPAEQMGLDPAKLFKKDLILRAQEEAYLDTMFRLDKEHTDATQISFEDFECLHYRLTTENKPPAIEIGEQQKQNFVDCLHKTRGQLGNCLGSLESYTKAVSQALRTTAEKRAQKPKETAF